MGEGNLLNRIKITDTSLRDGHQSLWATRMSLEDMHPILEKLDNVGYHSLEVWGGATFDVAVRFLNEDPWERLRTIRSIITKTRLQMLLRGQSLVGYAHYPDDIVERFVERAAYNGIDIFRIFDALNDIRNLEVPIQSVKKVGKHVQACVVYTISPVHTMEYFVETGLRLEDMGADSLCIKDMAGLLGPYQAYDLIKALKARIDIPIQLHTHYIGGLAVGACLKGAEAGVDIVDTASVPLAFGSSQPPVETIVRALQGTPWDTGLDIHVLFEVASFFEDIRKKKGFERGVTRINDMKVFEHQVPGGMITNFVTQLEEQKAVHKLNQVLEEIPRVRADLGYPPLVTPTSQIVGNQAVFNVLAGERYKMCPKEVKDYVRGFYGKPTVPIRDEIKKKIIGDEEIITIRPADLLNPGWEKAREESANLAKSDEDILTYALFPQVARKFFEYRNNRAEGADLISLSEQDKKPKPSAPPAKPAQKVIKSDKGNEDMDVDRIRELILLLDETSLAELEYEGPEFRLNLRKGLKNGSDAGSDQSGSAERPRSRKKQAKEETPDENLIQVIAPMVGTFYRSPSPDSPPFVEVGSYIEAGQTLCIVEAMKLMNEIKSEVKGRVAEILVENAQPVEYGQVMFLIAKE
ncbi:MAG: acetyl-CoA carboxylase biotin carboxyl carrier protein [Syntrophomonadales bacterium]|jgi:oxaloacetate decarboxylase alpha subunit